MATTDAAAGAAPSKGAPVDQDGNPVFHHKPESWDGCEVRWRTLALGDGSGRAVRCRSPQPDRSGVGRVSAVAVRSRCSGGRRTAGHSQLHADGGEADGEKPKTPETWAAHELADTETIAKLTTGVKRFALPDEFNHIAILKAVIARVTEKRQALESSD